MSAAAKEEMLASPSAEEIFSLAAGVAAALETREGTYAARGEKSHQGIFSKNRRPRVSSPWGKWSGTHQDRSLAWWETVLGPTIYLYDGMGANSNVIEEIDSSTNVLARYVQGAVVDEPLAEIQGSTTDYYEADGLGSIASLSNSAGALATSYVFDSYGKLTASTGSVTNPFQFTGREFDSESGLYYYRARYYDSTVGRFLSQDPSWFVDGPNLYPYVRNNPIGYFDPTGLAQLCCRPANVPIANAWARMTSQAKPCHCFVRLSDGHTLGGYFKFGLLVPQQDNPSDTGTNQATCNDMPGKPCRSDNDARRNFDAESWGIYGLNGTSNAVAVDISGGIRLLSCAWGQTPPSLPSLPSVPAPSWPLWPGFPDGGLSH